MKKDMIGAILKKRIKEKGYTQQQFAEEAGISLAALKKYMRGETAYSYEVMDMLADKLECSYDYLLGLSKSPVKEHHEIAEQTRLSEEAIKKIVKYASHYDDNFEARTYIKCLDRMLCEDGVFSSICDYLMASRFANDMAQGFISILQNALYAQPAIQELGIEEDRKLSLEMIQMINIICMLKDMKARMTPEFIAELRALDTVEDYNSSKEKLSNYLSRLSLEVKT